MRFSLSIIFCLTCTLIGCDRYVLTLNERPIHTPPTLFAGYSIADEALRNCVKQSISDAKITQVKDFLGLNCSTAGIKQLDGLEVFGSLETLILTNNDINRLTPLLILPSLLNVDLTNNPSLNCADIKPLTRRGVKIISPPHCG